MDAVDAARAVVEEHHPDARAAFLGGSVVTGRRTATSDLDIVVLLHGHPAPYRARGCPARHAEEAPALTPACLKMLIRK
jgi:predicted nucleotidyltransferase